MTPSQVNESHHKNATANALLTDQSETVNDRMETFAGTRLRNPKLLPPLQVWQVADLEQSTAQTITVGFRVDPLRTHPTCRHDQAILGSNGGMEDLATVACNGGLPIVEPETKTILFASEAMGSEV